MQIYFSPIAWGIVFVMNELTLKRINFMSIFEKFSRIKLLAFDLDGVLTNGKLLIMPDGEWVREMDIKDGFALQHAIKSGLHIAIITGSSSEPIGKRLNKLGVQEYFQNTGSKAAVLQSLMQKFKLQKDEVLFMGDDIPDLEAFEVSGCKTCPADAATEIMGMADYISPKKGGDGCARDVIEKVMKCRDIWTNSTNTQSI
jgi:3-deoxy-D-manno-octulosonate 8-phosphate phosphatase (KDO 8-P phosphatase)